MILPLILAAGLASAAPAPAPDAAKADAGKDFVCRIEQTTGTRFPKKVCRRKAEFEQKQRDEQDRLRQQQRPQYSCDMSGVRC